MTTQPDAGLECDLLQKVIRDSTQPTDQLHQQVLEWLGKRLSFPDPGFGHLGPFLEARCNAIHMLLNQQSTTSNMKDLCMKQLPGKLAELDRTYDVLISKIGIDDASRGTKIQKLDEWKAGKMVQFQHDLQVAEKQLGNIEIEIARHVDMMIDNVKTGHDKDPVFCDISSLLEEAAFILDEQPMDGTNLPQILPENQLGDETVCSPQNGPDQEEPLQSKAVVKRLIVPPGCDVPIKQHMVDIFHKTRQPVMNVPEVVPVTPAETPVVGSSVGNGSTEASVADAIDAPSVENGSTEKPAVENDVETPMVDNGSNDGTLTAPSCEETAAKYIAQLEDGATKQALLSLCEASLSKVGWRTIYDVNLCWGRDANKSETGVYHNPFFCKPT